VRHVEELRRHRWRFSTRASPPDSAIRQIAAVVARDREILEEIAIVLVHERGKRNQVERSIRGDDD
jgi:hypothetical protein